MPVDVESVDEPLQARPVGARRRTSRFGGAGASGGPGADIAAPGRMEYLRRELKVAVEETNLRLRRMGKNVVLEVFETPRGPGIRLEDPDRGLAQGRAAWELARAMSPAGALKWLERLQSAKGLVVDERA